MCKCNLLSRQFSISLKQRNAGVSLMSSLK